MIIIDRQKLYNLEKYSLSGNRTPVSSVTDWDTYHYTKGALILLLAIRRRFVGDLLAIRRRFVGDKSRCALSYFLGKLRGLPTFAAE